MAMYSPGNSVVVNLLMRFPALIPVAVCCAVSSATPTPTPIPDPAPDVQAIESTPAIDASTQVEPEVTCPRGLKLHYVNGVKRCVRG